MGGSVECPRTIGYKSIPIWRLSRSEPLGGTVQGTWLSCEDGHWFNYGTRRAAQEIGILFAMVGNRLLRPQSI
jgi:hypothetical protein